MTLFIDANSFSLFLFSCGIRDFSYASSSGAIVGAREYKARTLIFSSTWNFTVSMISLFLILFLSARSRCPTITAYRIVSRHFIVGVEYLHSRPKESAVIFNVFVITMRVTERENNEGGSCIPKFIF